MRKIQTKKGNQKMIRTFLRITALTFSLFTAVALLAAGSRYFGSTAQQGQEQTEGIKIDNFSSSPANLTVAVGTTVTWINRDDIPRTVVSSDDPKVFKSKALDIDDRFSFTFTNVGHCATSYSRYTNRHAEKHRKASGIRLR
jgi:plastocyanin